MQWRSPAGTVYNLIRAVTHPYPGAFTFFRGKRLFIWTARPLLSSRNGATPPASLAEVREGQGLVVGTGAGQLLLTRVQLAGEEEQRGDEFGRRHGMVRGERLGE